MKPLAGALPLLLLWALPLAGGLAMLLPALADGGAWQMAFAHPQLWPGLALSLATGAAATLIALAAAMLLIAGLRQGAAWSRLQALAATGLAIPHLAFAIGFGFLVMPSGLIARLLVGGDEPPQWVSVQDPWGITLTLALALKEIPFLLTAATPVLLRGNAALRLEREMRAAASLGHGPGSAALRVLLPQLLPALAWPLVIVFSYGATVVDMALVLGPTQPPTLAVVIWRALNDVDPAVNSMGLSATLLLTGALALVLVIAMASVRGLQPMIRRALTPGPSQAPAPRAAAAASGLLALGVLGVTMALLLLLSLAPRWPYPDLLPPAASLVAWATLTTAPAPMILSLALSAAVAVTAVATATLWFETQPPGRDGLVLAIALAALTLPQLASAGGQYRLFLRLGLTGTLPGLFLAHLTPVLAYVLIVLRGPWRGFDQRYVKAAQALAASGARAFAAVKLPLLKAPIATAGAIGFAVAFAQFVPAQLVAAGRFSTLPMEAVTLSSGGNRALTATFALALALPALAAFLAAALAGRPRWR